MFASRCARARALTAHRPPWAFGPRWSLGLLAAGCDMLMWSYYELRRNLGTKWHVRGPVDFVEHRTDNGQRQEPGVLIHGSNN